MRIETYSRRLTYQLTKVFACVEGSSAGARVVVTVGKRQEAALKALVSDDVDDEDNRQDEHDPNTGYDNSEDILRQRLTLVVSKACLI